MSNPVRLAKRVVELTSCSRREAELYIAGGWVSVDGQVVEEPQFMVDEQKVVLHPDATLTPVAPVTILFNQPVDIAATPLLNPDETTCHSTKPASGQVAGYLPQAGEEANEKNTLQFPQQLIRAETQAADDHSGIRLLKQHLFKLTQCLPSERNASGLSVYTQDFHVSRKLKDDAATIEQEYVVEVAGEMIPDGLKLLNHGLSFNGKPLAPVKVSWQNETRLRFALKGIQPGQIAYACEQVGLQVVTMKRLRIGRVAMGKLPQGEWRYLNGYERF